MRPPAAPRPRARRHPAQVARSGRGDAKVARPDGSERWGFARHGRWFLTQRSPRKKRSQRRKQGRAPGRIPHAAKPQRPQPPAPDTRARPSMLLCDLLFLGDLCVESAIAALPRRRNCATDSGGAGFVRSPGFGGGWRCGFYTKSSPYFSQSARALARSLPRQVPFCACWRVLPASLSATMQVISRWKWIASSGSSRSIRVSVARPRTRASVSASASTVAVRGTSR